MTARLLTVVALQKDEEYGDYPLTQFAQVLEVDSCGVFPVEKVVGPNG